MFAGAARLAGVVQQQCQQEQIEAIDLRKQLRQALFIVVCWRAQAMHIVDTKEGVLVDGVAMITVANHQRIDAMEFGNQHFQHAQRMHGSQRMRSVRPISTSRRAFQRYGPSECEWRAREVRR